MERHIVNKSIIRDFYQRAVGQGDIAFAEAVLADDYIQHSPAVKPGKAGVIEALQYLKQMPKPANPAQPFMRLIAEGDYVVTNLCFEWGGKQKVVVDLFRLHNGKVAEHWDATQDQPETTLNGHAMMDGPREVEDTDLTQANKKIAEAFYQRVFVNQKLDVLPDYVAPDLIQHHPEIDNGLAGLEVYLQKQSGTVSIRKIHRTIGEGNFVVIQSEGQTEGMPCVYYAIFRLSKGKIIEQWSVNQLIPPAKEHQKGMI